MSYDASIGLDFMDGFSNPVVTGADLSSYYDWSTNNVPAGYLPQASNAPAASSSGLSMSMPSASTFDSILSSVTKGIDYGLKTVATFKNADLQMKSLDLQQYLAESKMGIMATQAGSAVEVEKIKAAAQSNLARTYQNAAGSTANLAAMGGTSSSLMLYLTIAGVLFAFIQVIQSRK